MTKTVQVTDLREVKALTLACAKCGASFSLPVGRHTTPEACFSCEAPLDRTTIDELIAILRRLHRGEEAPWRITFETDPER